MKYSLIFITGCMSGLVSASIQALDGSQARSLALKQSIWPRGYDEDLLFLLPRTAGLGKPLLAKSGGSPSSSRNASPGRGSGSSDPGPSSSAPKSQSRGSSPGSSPRSTKADQSGHILSSTPRKTDNGKERASPGQIARQMSNNVPFSSIISPAKVGMETHGPASTYMGDRHGRWNSEVTKKGNRMSGTHSSTDKVVVGGKSSSQNSVVRASASGRTVSSTIDTRKGGRARMRFSFGGQAMTGNIGPGVREALSIKQGVQESRATMSTTLRGKGEINMQGHNEENNPRS